MSFHSGYRRRLFTTAVPLAQPRVNQIGVYDSRASSRGRSKSPRDGRNTVVLNSLDQSSIVHENSKNCIFSDDVDGASLHTGKSEPENSR